MGSLTFCQTRSTLLVLTTAQPGWRLKMIPEDEWKSGKKNNYEGWLISHRDGALFINFKNCLGVQ